MAAHKKSGKKFLAVREKSGNYFSAKSVHAHPRKPELFSLIKIPDKPSKNTHFSDVNAIAGNQGHLQAVSVKKSPEICVKKSDQISARYFNRFYSI